MTGVQRFSYNLTLELINNFAEYRLIIPQNSAIFNLKVSKEKIIKCGKKDGFFWEQIELPFFLKKNGNPLLISFSGLGPINYKNKISTIHDLSFIDNPKWFKLSYYILYRIFTPIIIRQSKKILTVSNFSKDEIISKFYYAKNKTEVIYNAVHSKLQDFSLTEKKKIILSVGSLDPRKNLRVLVDSFLKWNNYEYRLYILGGGNKSFSKLNLPKHERVIYLGYVKDDELEKYYLKSEIFIYPSLYEGFGLPPIEAMSYGIPVIVSDRTSLPEVCADAAYYINPSSTSSIIKALNDLVTNKELQRDLVNRGFKNLDRFSWVKSAKIVDEIVKKL
jgi:glycosyltransferase involved in cell wall biosynthesis